MTIENHELREKIKRTPKMWWGAAKAWLAMTLGRTSVVVTRNKVKISAGLARGRGLWCAISGLDFEPELRWAVTRLTKGCVVIDIGANVGVYTLHCGRKVVPSGKVISFEPGEDAFAALQKNVTLNKLQKFVDLHMAGCAAEDGQFYFAGDPGAWFTQRLSTTPTDRKVVVRSVDSVVEQNGLSRLDLMKVDAEGFEYEVFKGAEKSLIKFHPTLIFESMKDGKEQVHQLLQSLGYLIFRLDASGQLTRDIDSGRVVNLIALPKDNLP
jgi:FkbM family methyltransferase